MCCYNCKQLDEENKKNGCEGGALFYCKCKKEYIDVRDTKCEEFEKEYRSDETISKMKEECKSYDDMPFSPEVIFIFTVILVIIGLIMDVF